MPTASGRFEVKLDLLPMDDAPGLGRRSINKQFSGELEAVSVGQMLSAGGSVKGSAGYVALEIVRGRLGGREGSFALQHFGLMDRGTPSLTVVVVPDSGTDALTGLSGRMSIDIAGGEHRYTFEYDLPESA